MFNRFGAILEAVFVVICHRYEHGWCTDKTPNVTNRGIESLSLIVYDLGFRQVFAKVSRVGLECQRTELQFGKYESSKARTYNYHHLPIAVALHPSSRTRTVLPPALWQLPTNSSAQCTRLNENYFQHLQRKRTFLCGWTK